MSGQKRAADEVEEDRYSSTFRPSGPASSAGMPNLRLVVLTTDTLIDGREAKVSAITKLFEITNNQVGYSVFAAPSSFGFEPQFSAGSGGNRGQMAQNGMALLRVPSREEILRALGRGPRYIHDVLYELGLNPARANEGYMPPRHFVLPPSTAHTHVRTSPNGRIPGRHQANLRAALTMTSFNEASRNLPMVQQYIDLLAEEKFHLYPGAKAFLARCHANNIAVVVMTDHQGVFTRIVKDEGVPENHIAMVISHLTDSLHFPADFHKMFGNEIITRLQINPLPVYRHRDLTAQFATGAGSPGGRRAGDESKTDSNTAKDKEADIDPSGDVSMGDAAATGADTATSTDTRAGFPHDGPITVHDTPEPPMITVTDSADTTNATTTDQDSAMKSKGKRPELEPLNISNLASSLGAQPRTPSRNDPHTPTQPSGSLYSDTTDTPHTPTQRELLRRAESPTTPTPPQGSRAHARANMRQPAPTDSTSSDIPRVDGSSDTPNDNNRVEMPGNFIASALGITRPVATPTRRRRRRTILPEIKPLPTSSTAGTMAPPPRRSPPAPALRDLTLGKDILMASSTPIHLQVVGQLLCAKKVWIKNHPGLQPRPRNQLPAHQDGGLLVLNTIAELNDYLFGEEDPFGGLVDMDMMDVDVDNMEIFQFSARDEHQRRANARASASAAVSGPPSLLPLGCGADKGKGKATDSAVVNVDGDSDDDVQILDFGNTTLE